MASDGLGAPEGRDEFFYVQAALHSGEEEVRPFAELVGAPFLLPFVLRITSPDLACFLEGHYLPIVCDGVPIHFFHLLQMSPVGYCSPYFQ